MLKRFEEAVKKHNMFSFGDSVTVGLSGGSDSVCLLYLLISLREKYDLKIYAAHINHGIRETAGKDEDFVKNLCDKWYVPIYVKKSNVSEMAKELKISEELCGRNIRYEFFEEVASETGSTAILTAHNKNDNAETILLHLIRGSGSLTAIMPRRGNICRPLLDFSKSEIEEYLVNNKINWVEDETNAENIYTRNSLRNEIIPLLKEINPSVEDSIIRCARLLKEDDDFISSVADSSNAFTDGKIDTDILSSLPLPAAKRVIIKAIKSMGFELSEVTVNAVLNLLSKQSGKKYIFPCGGVAVKEYGEIVFTKQDESTYFSARISAGDKIYISEISKYISLSKEKPDGEFIAVSDKCTHLNIRSFIPGDSFTPSGMNGTKKLKDFFSDKKIPLSERSKIPVFLADEKIVSVGTMRCDSHFLPESKNNALYIKISEY